MLITPPVAEGAAASRDDRYPCHSRTALNHAKPKLRRMHTPDDHAARQSEVICHHHSESGKDTRRFGRAAIVGADLLRANFPVLPPSGSVTYSCNYPKLDPKYRQ